MLADTLRNFILVPVFGNPYTVIRRLYLWKACRKTEYGLRVTDTSHYSFAEEGMIPDSPGAFIMNSEVAFEQTIFIKSSVARVWQALTEKADIDRYFLCPLRAMGDVGEHVIYGTEDAVMISGLVLEKAPGESLRHTFLFTADNHEGTEADEETVVSYTIEAVNEQGTIVALTFRHSGFPEKNQTYANITGGWPFILSNLKTYLETGRTLHT